MDVNDAPLQVTLSLLLDQVGLAYVVKDDVLIISSPQGSTGSGTRRRSWQPTHRHGRRRCLPGSTRPSHVLRRWVVPGRHSRIHQARDHTPSWDGIPIYVDPSGLQEALVSLTSTVSIDLDGVPLKTTLRLMLSQLGLAYTVKDGLLIISSAEDIVTRKRQAEWRVTAPHGGRPSLRTSFAQGDDGY